MSDTQRLTKKEKADLHWLKWDALSVHAEGVARIIDAQAAVIEKQQGLLGQAIGLVASGKEYAREVELTGLPAASHVRAAPEYRTWCDEFLSAIEQLEEKLEPKLDPRLLYPFDQTDVDAAIQAKEQFGGSDHI